MRRTTALLVALAFTLPLLAACSSNGSEAAPESSEAAPAASGGGGIESVPPTAGDVEPDDFRKDVTAVRADRAPDAQFPAGDTVRIRFALTNHGPERATYTVTFGVYDVALTQVGAFGVDTSSAGPTAVGRSLAYDDFHGMSTGHLPTGAFTVEVQSVDRVSVPSD